MKGRITLKLEEVQKIVCEYYNSIPDESKFVCMGKFRNDSQSDETTAMNPLYDDNICFEFGVKSRER
jgi:hypothetical protein